MTNVDRWIFRALWFLVSSMFNLALSLTVWLDMFPRIGHGIAVLMAVALAISLIFFTVYMLIGLEEMLEDEC